MMTSWAPTPFIMSKMPSPLRPSSPSMRRAGKLVRHDAHGPVLRSSAARRCCGRPAPRAVSRCSWPPQKAHSVALRRLSRARKVGRAARPLRGNDHPPTHDWVLAQLRHCHDHAPRFYRAFGAVGQGRSRRAARRAGPSVRPRALSTRARQGYADSVRTLPRRAAAAIARAARARARGPRRSSRRR